MVTYVRFGLKGGLKDFTNYVSNFGFNIDKYATPNIARRIVKEIHKTALNNLSRYTKLTPTLRSKIKEQEIRRIENKTYAGIYLEDEAVFWEFGVRPHIVSFYPSNPTPSWIGTSRSYFRQWFMENYGVDEEFLIKQQNAIVSIPTTHFLTRAIVSVKGRVDKIIKEEIKKNHRRK